MMRSDDISGAFFPGFYSSEVFEYPGHPPETERAAERSRAPADAVTVISAQDDPGAFCCLADELADVMGPHDDAVEARSVRRQSVMQPIAREVIGDPRIARDMMTHEPSAPCGGPNVANDPDVMMPTGMQVMPTVMMPGVRRSRSREKGYS